MKSRKDTSRVRSPKDQESGKPWPPWQCRATLQLSTYILLCFHPQFSYQCSRVPDPEKTYWALRETPPVDSNFTKKSQEMLLTGHWGIIALALSFSTEITDCPSGYPRLTYRPLNGHAAHRYHHRYHPDTKQTISIPIRPTATPRPAASSASLLY